MQFQIHIAGTKRSGKTTVAQIIQEGLERAGCRTVILEVDNIRRALFGRLDAMAAIGSPENLALHLRALEAMFNVAIPGVLEVNGTPIVVTTHSRRRLYDTARKCAQQHAVPFRFIMLESPPYEEVQRRARADTSSLSDTRDFNDPAVTEEYWVSRRRLEAEYAELEIEKDLFRLPQGTPEQMTAAALRFIFG